MPAAPAACIHKENKEYLVALEQTSEASKPQNKSSRNRPLSVSCNLCIGSNKSNDGREYEKKSLKDVRTKVPD